MSFKKFARPLALIVAVAALLLSTLPAEAATPASGGNGLRVSPVRTDLTLNPGQVQTVDVSVTNVTSGDTHISVSINDFVADKSKEDGNPALLDDGQSSGLHSLRQFIKPVDGFPLKAGQEKTIRVTVTIPKGTAGGGYYGAVKFTPSSSGDTAGKNVTLSGSVGSLVLLKVTGNVKDQLTLASFDVRNGDSARTLFFSNKNLQAVARFKNEGNVQEQPFGKVLLKDSSGKVLEQHEINDSSPRGNALPDSIRRFSVPLSKVGTFGKYTVEGNFGYGSNGQLLSAKTTFYVVPLALAILVIVIIVLILLAIFVLPKLIRAYNRRVIRRASR